MESEIINKWDLCIHMKKNTYQKKNKSKEQLRGEDTTPIISDLVNNSVSVFLPRPTKYRLEFSDTGG